MKRKLGVLCIILGCGFLAAALSLYLYNRREQIQAANASQEAIAGVVEAIVRKQEDTSPAEETASVAPWDRVMTVTEIDGYGYIGFLGLPALGLELPVMTDWTYPQLQIAPCRYSGSIYSDDLVIMAHNYPKHFGKLKDMHYEDIVTFTDMEGETTTYQVAALDVLAPEAVEEMTAGDYDLTLFTCTYGGENRVVLRCDRIKE